MILGSLKDRVFGRRKRDIDYGDIRSQVVGERFQQEPPTVRERFGLERANEFPKDPYAPEPFAQAPQPEPFFPAQQQAFGSRPEPRDFGFEQPQPARNDYDILDRLNLIESQLSAIRSQTETINERLKNIDARLTGRRY